MKLNNKGFTLTEVLAVVAILSMLLIIVVPNANGLITRNNNNAYENLKVGIISATKIYLAENKNYIKLEGICENTSRELNINSIKNNGLESSKIILKYLTDNKYLTTNNKEELVNPKNSSLKLDLNNSYIIVKYDCNKYDYNYILEDNYLVWK